MKHTIVLMQLTPSRSSRTFSDYESVSAAMNGICRNYEERLQQIHPGRQNITYQAKELFDYIDNLPDLSCLVFNRQLVAYVPYNKEWIKSRLLVQLKKIAGIS
eukprot:TRINITY_DN6022_c2_g1_i1.p1 TRINITY_DN6022_c2_g1~~TRINITY_DN6022_c2_g1_i1.p1  ORF type:complete len:103 (+),score=36.46 TRINITY_DN6022_c2_g1_i1:217-525(+)